ncbi:MAG: GNAT family N-acetyltransferase [Gemmatimonadales bacterium]
MHIAEASPSHLARYAQVPIGFEVRERLTVVSADSRFLLAAEAVPTPYLKNYDAIPGNHPTDWPSRFDVSRWGILVAESNDAWVGGAVIAHGGLGLEMLEGRTDLAALWDIRVAPALRGQDIGGQLFRAAETWAVARGTLWLNIETQDINVPACRFYQRHGCTLETANRNAYPDLPDEVQLIWRKSLGSSARAAGPLHGST